MEQASEQQCISIVISRLIYVVLIFFFLLFFASWELTVYKSSSNAIGKKEREMQQARTAKQLLFDIHFTQ